MVVAVVTIVLSIFAIVQQFVNVASPGSPPPAIEFAIPIAVLHVFIIGLSIALLVGLTLMLPILLKIWIIAILCINIVFWVLSIVVAIVFASQNAQLLYFTLGFVAFNIVIQVSEGRKDVKKSSTVSIQVFFIAVVIYAYKDMMENMPAKGSDQYPSQQIGSTSQAYESDQQAYESGRRSVGGTYYPHRPPNSIV